MRALGSIAWLALASGCAIVGYDSSPEADPPADASTDADSTGDESTGGGGSDAADAADDSPTCETEVELAMVAANQQGSFGGAHTALAITLGVNSGADPLARNPGIVGGYAGTDLYRAEAPGYAEIVDALASEQMTVELGVFVVPSGGG